ncbi:FtsK/SpoIIIE domain-containing protein [Flexivirga oryzae]|uniref:S-DNA-T family DNA segregation ATPase FtsK/SpoIIIE n=1 Tax=Flexivirga oryzae TaxID=1794944 RepID=A0A839N2A6_9MICO|nr:FtsK/SpoIIIE domain-containing protein [Flexivirga oryzae]MBB2890043.1 S-DNA-T family DNA segregation ATPase FtsK/SpoIIIE [Flexivirga oryzae]
MPTDTTNHQEPTSRAIRLRLVALDGTAVTACVRAGERATWAEIRQVMRTCGLTVPDRLYAGSDLLDDSTNLGHHPLYNGVQLSPAPTAAQAPHLLDLVVTEGPDVGARTALSAQVQRIGRGPSSSLVLSDPGLSRTHLVVGVDQGRAMVSDAGSTNGSRIDDHRLDPERPVEVRAGQRLRVGNTTIALERALHVAEAVATDESCRIRFQRAPRVPLRLTATTLERPTPPVKPERHRVPWPLIVLPMLVAVGMVLLLHNAMFLMFALLGPVMMIGQHLSDRQGGASRVRQQRAEYATALTLLADTRRGVSTDELTIRRRIAPPISDALRAAATRDSRLWARSPTHDDYLSCRIGIGTIPSLIQVSGGGAPPETVTLLEAPITLCLNDSRIIGLTGQPIERLRLAHGLLLQLAAWQSPRFLRLIVVCDSAASRARWDWAADLPHVTPGPHAPSTILDLETDETSCQKLLSDLSPECDDNASITDRDRPAVSTVLVLDGWDTLGKRAEVTELLAATKRGGIAIIALGDAADLPAECAASIEVRSSMSVVVSGAVNASGCPDLPLPDLSHTFARLLAQVCDATPDVDAGAAPDRAALLDVWRADGCDPTDASNVVDHWVAQRRSTVAPLGVSAEGSLLLDLAADGPHALVAGTTGAGKSELLQSLVTSLAVANRPDEMCFVLVDYKGGAAFQDCANLPHTLGLVTDLDAHLTARALTSLGAEVRRREQLLGHAGAKDIEDYLRLPDLPPLPRLVLVIDEFRVLAEEMPDFISGLVRLAAVGRSLGIHLVLATQRPAGVISADIRANVNLRIALRVRDDADSQDVIETGLAAGISSASPGRAILRTGGSRPLTFQTARIGGRSVGERADIEVSKVVSAVSAPTLLSAARTADGPTDLQRVVAAIRCASEQLGVTPPKSPWLPPLSEAVTTADLTGPAHGIQGAPCGTDAIPFGLLDLPHEQTTRTVSWDLEADGHLAVIGGPRSGRTSLLRTLAVQAALTWPTEGFAIYVVDTESALGVLTGLPQCGAVIERDDVGRITALVQWLSNEIRSRRQQFARESVTEFSEHLRGGGTLPRILLLVDGWEALNDVSEEATLGRMTDELLQVIRDGPAVGLYAAASGGRALGTGRVASDFSSRLVLDLADRSDVVLLGMREADLPAAMPPGRAVICPAALELQVALPTDDPSGTVVAQYISRISGKMRGTHVRRFTPVPSSCRRGDLPVDTDQVLVGIGGAQVTPMGLPLGGFGELAALIAGPVRSGRTTTLATIAHQLRDRPICWIDGHGQPPDVPDVPDGTDVLDAASPETFAAWLNAHPGGAVLVDDLDDLLGSPIDDLLADYLQHGRRHGGIVCATGQTDSLMNAFRGAVAELRRRQTGIILQPGRRDGDLLGATLAPAGRPQPGRGALVIRSRAVPIQVAA